MLGLRSTLLEVLSFTSVGLEMQTPLTSIYTCECWPTIYDGDRFCSIIFDGVASSLVLFLVRVSRAVSASARVML